MNDGNEVCIASHCLKKNGTMVFLDDGTASISFLKGVLPTTSIKESFLDRFIRFYVKNKDIDMAGYHFTIYYDIEKPVLKIYPNRMRMLNF